MKFFCFCLLYMTKNRAQKKSDRISPANDVPIITIQKKINILDEGKKLYDAELVITTVFLEEVNGKKI